MMHVQLTDTELAIARSVVYASLFEYPLTLAQLRKALIGATLTPTEITNAIRESPWLQQIIEERAGLFYPRGQEHLVALRKAREQGSRQFLRRHRPLLRLICAMPYVRLVALSGSVAHRNMEGEGDLDLFIVTRGRHAWTVTVAAIVLAKLLRRRHILCANFVIADVRLQLEQQDLFSASQVIHLEPLAGHAVYRAFVDANPFVTRFYPNFHYGAAHRHDGVSPAKRAAEVLLAPAAWPMERLCRWLYGRYLRRRSARWESPDGVQLAPDCLKLHTRSHRRDTLDRFRRALDETLARVDVAISSIA